MLCTRCKKRTAVVFITAMQGEEKHNQGLCLVCAKELGIPQVKEYMDQMGISDDEVEEFSDQMTDFSDSLDGDSFQEAEQVLFRDLFRIFLEIYPKVLLTS